MAASLAMKGKPLLRAKPLWVSARLARMPVVHRAASWTNCRAKRGWKHSAAVRLQPTNKSQVPRRKCSGTNNHSPKTEVLTLSARSCRTPRSRLWGSQGSACFCPRDRWACRVSSAPGRQRCSFFLKAKVADDPFDRARADGPAGLAEFLGDDRGG